MCLGEQHAQQCHADVEAIVCLTEICRAGIGVDLLGNDLIHSRQGMHDNGRFSHAVEDGLVDDILAAHLLILL